MGNHRFRLSDMMPNAWFYKLRDMSTHTRRRKYCHPIPRIHDKNKFPSTSTQPRQNNFYNSNTTTTTSPMTLAQHILFDSPTRNTDIPLPPNPPRKSPKRLFTTHRKSIYKPCISTSPRARTPMNQDPLYYSISPCSDHLHSPLDSPPSSDPFDEVASWSMSSSRLSSSTADIIIDIDERFDDFVSLPPILTKSNASKYKRDKKAPLESKPRRKPRYSKSGYGAKVRRRNSPKMTLAMSFKKMQVIHRRKERSSISDSFAVIKCSYDPEKDFKDSMMEMIVEHQIQASKQLEELLVCYLTLNSKEYHDLIVKAFEQIWCEMFCYPQCADEV